MTYNIKKLLPLFLFPKKSKNFSLWKSCQKCLEKIVKTKVLKETEHLLNPLQFAYRHGKGVEDVTLTILSLVHTHLEKEKAHAIILFVRLSCRNWSSHSPISVLTDLLLKTEATAPTWFWVKPLFSYVDPRFSAWETSESVYEWLVRRRDSAVCIIYIAYICYRELVSYCFWGVPRTTKAKSGPLTGNCRNQADYV